MRTEEQTKRLLEAARVCRETKYPRDFHMGYFSICGTPGCVLGNLAFCRDIPDNPFHISGLGSLMFNGEHIDYDDPQRVCDWFGITPQEASELFGVFGCGGFVGGYTDDGGLYVKDKIITDPIAAAEYIENFVRKSCASTQT